MSQNQSNSSVPSNDELEHFNKCQLLSFLKSRGVKQTEDILLKVAKLVANRPVITVTSDHTTSLTINSVLEWKNAATEVAPIPKGFNLETLTNYLREISCNLAMQDEEELVYSGTQKPVLKGRKMYQSMKLQMAQFGVAGTDLFFRANCSASLKNKETRYPSVRISHEGAVLKGSCVRPYLFLSVWRIQDSIILSSLLLASLCRDVSGMTFALLKIGGKSGLAIPYSKGW